jgi:hypothetical protein
MMQIFKAALIGVGVLVGLVVFALSCLLLLLFPEWVRWVAGCVSTFAVAWFFLFGRFRRKSGLLINDGTVYDRWRGRSKSRKDFL